MPVSRLSYLIIFAATFSFRFLAAQDSVSYMKPGKVKETDHFTVSYSIALKSNKDNTGIGEAYNGGVKTIFISGNKARVRLVSLMRMQSIFIVPLFNSKQEAVIIKESGKDKYKYFMDTEQWEQYNRKYDSAACEMTNDSMMILNYPCRKALVKLQDGRSITVFYTDSLRNKMLAKIEPAFSCIPGLVLQYEYKYKKGAVTYTATSINNSPIDPGVFKIPMKGFVLRKFSPDSSTKQGKEID